MSLSIEWVAVIQEFLRLRIISHNPVFGGDINQAVFIETTEGEYFIKIQGRPNALDMLTTEKKGLEFLRSKGHSQVPEPLKILQSKSEVGLLMPYIHEGKPNNEFWYSLGNSVSLLHQQTNAHFGLDHDNYIGLIEQSNQFHQTWSEFYASERLLPLARKCSDQHLLKSQEMNSLGALCQRIDEIYPSEPPALLHGDLWSGNFICQHDQSPVFIDPAVYFGHREMDIAMTLLFGGFHDSFYSHYQDQYPLEKGWEERIKYSQLYYLLVHLSLFGSSYHSSVSSILSEF